MKEPCFKVRYFLEIMVNVGHLERHLESFDIPLHGKHDVLGEWSTFLNHKTKQGYLERAKMANGEDIELSWGPRAKIEYPMENMIEFIVALYGSTSSNQLKSDLQRMGKAIFSEPQ
jgi:hypothetical protein